MWGQNNSHLNCSTSQISKYIVGFCVWMRCSVLFTCYISNNQVRKAILMETLQKYLTDFSWVHSWLIFPSAVMKCCLTEDRFMVFYRSDLCIRRHQITHNPDGPVQHFQFLVRVMRKSKQPASHPKSTQFLDLPLKTLLMGWKSASSFSLWRLCHRNCRTSRPSLLFSLYSKNKRDYLHAIQMRRKAWRQVQAGNYTPCLQMCSSTQWRLIYGAPISEGDVTRIYPCDQWEAAPVFLIHISEHLSRYLEVRLWSSQKQKPLEGQTGPRVS